MIAAGREVWWNRRQILERTDLQDQIHAYHDVEQEVTMEQPETCGRVKNSSIALNRCRNHGTPPTTLTRIISAETHYHVAIVWDGDGILQWWVVVLSVQQTTAIEVERVLQIDLLHVGVGRTSNTDHIVRVTVQMERMAQIGLLD